MRSWGAPVAGGEEDAGGAGVAGGAGDAAGADDAGRAATNGGAAAIVGAAGMADPAGAAGAAGNAMPGSGARASTPLATIAIVVPGTLQASKASGFGYRARAILAPPFVISSKALHNLTVLH